MKNELISQFEWMRKSSKLDKYAREILNDESFYFEPYEDKNIGDELITLQVKKEMWTEEYFGKQITLLTTNFSKERLLHCLELREYIDGVKFQKTNKKLYFLIGSVILLVIASGVLYMYVKNSN
jgi:hypothetical protein